jgi:stage II sporulation protein R
MVKKHLIRLGVILILSLSIFATLALLPVSEGDSGEAEQLQEGVVRFHVIAKSDETVDQELKLDVRDAVLDYLRPSLEGVQDQQGAAALIQDKIPEIEQVAVKTLRAQGCSDPVDAYFGVFDFPVRVYGPLTFPEGKYQSLRVVLGEGKGKNWWCCLFPPANSTNLFKIRHLSSLSSAPPITTSVPRTFSYILKISLQSRIRHE